MTRSVLPAAVNRSIDKKRLELRVEEGLPQGFDPSLLAAIVRRERDTGFVAVRHAPLQAWKLTSAYVVWMSLEDGTSWTLVVKDARFGDDDFPAIRGLSFEPGVPEYSLYSKMTSSLQRFTPRIYGVAELESGKHYQYVMEDLSVRHHPLYNERDRIRILGRVADVHEALRDWVGKNESTSLLTYDRDYVNEIILHAESGLDSMSGIGRRDIIEPVRAIWPDVVAYLTAERNLSRRRLRPIHGDLNTKNCFVPNSNSDQARIVDWEWSGYGTVHDDVASLLKRSNRKLDERALRIIGRIEPELGEQDHLELLWWSRLATAVRDASLLSHQLAGLEEPSAVIARRACGLWRGLVVRHAQLNEALSTPH